MAVHFQKYLLVVGSFLMCSCSNKIKKNDDHIVKKVDMELLFPGQDPANNWIFLNCSDNPITVTFKNKTDSAVYFYNDKYSEGYNDFSFELKTADSTYLIKKESKRAWLHGGSYFGPYTVNANETLAYSFNLKCDTCYFDEVPDRVFPGDRYGWTGLPSKGYDSAFIKAVYELKELDDSSLLNKFPKKLETKYYKIKIGVGFIGFKKIIDIK